MMNYKEHCRRSVDILGEECREVHWWLDEFACDENGRLDDTHRRKRHHKAGIKQVGRMWGDQAAEAARLHILDDLREGGEGFDAEIADDEEDYVRKGYW
jgi:hypothetical protein